MAFSSDNNITSLSTGLTNTSYVIANELGSSLGYYGSSSNYGAHIGVMPANSDYDLFGNYAQAYMYSSSEVMIGYSNTISYMTNGGTVNIGAQSTTIHFDHEFNIRVPHTINSSAYESGNGVFQIRRHKNDNGSYASYWELECYIPSNLQYGIYARFA